MKIDEAYQIAVEKYRKKTATSEIEYEKGKQYFPGGVTRYTNFYKPYPLTMIKGNGPHVYDIDGNKYIDYINNYGSLIHGHSHPEISKSVDFAIHNGTAISASIPDQLEMAELLCERIPSFEVIRYCNSGLEATLFAIKIARAYTGRNEIIKMEGGFHGLHDIVEFSISPPVNNVASDEELKPIPDSIGLSKRVADEVHIVPFNDEVALEKLLEKKSEDIAAIIVEPVMGLSGMILPKEGYLQTVRELADKYNVVLIFDEIQTLRMSTGGAQAYYGVTPDLTTVAKIIGGGFPCGAFGGKREIMQVMDPNNNEYVNHGGTFSGNNVTMAAGITALKLFDEDAVTRLNELSARLENGMLKAIQDNNLDGTITRAGSMLHYHLRKGTPLNYKQVYKFSKDDILRNYIHLELLNRGIFTSPRGTWYLSTVMTEELVDETIKAFEEVMQQIKRLN